MCVAQVKRSEGEALARQHRALFASVSSMEGHGVIPAFKALAEAVIVQGEAREKAAETRQTVSLSDPHGLPPVPIGAQSKCC